MSVGNQRGLYDGTDQEGMLSEGQRMRSDIKSVQIQTRPTAQDILNLRENRRDSIQAFKHYRLVEQGVLEDPGRLGQDQEIKCRSRSLCLYLPG